MPRLPVVKPKEVPRALKRAGFFIDRQRGSHIALRRNQRKGTVTVSLNKKDLKPKTLKSIINQAGLMVDEFIEFLQYKSASIHK